jgi:hypothetical protein
MPSLTGFRRDKSDQESGTKTCRVVLCYLVCTREEDFAVVPSNGLSLDIVGGDSVAIVLLGNANR